MQHFFADTYALMAHVDGSKRYVPLLSASDYVTTAVNASEFAHALLRRGLRSIDEILDAVADHVVAPHPNVALAAAQFKLDRIGAGGKCSFVDAWGYATAQSLGLPFLTGDEDFRGVPGVKFVKA